MHQSVIRKARSILVPAFISLAVISVLPGCSPKEQTNQIDTRTRSFDNDWKFSVDSMTGAEQPGFDDSNWRVLDLPHDWSIEDIPQQVEGKTIGPFSKESPGGAATGHVLGGTGWYRKTFTIDPADSAKLITIYFEGAYMETDVWINGRHAGYHPYGYTSFSYDITKLLNTPGQPNTVAVRVVNNGKNSRWYSGSGIYRHVRLIVTNPLHIDQWGVYITTPHVSSAEATVKIVTNITNEKNERSDFKIHTHILDANGQFVTETETSQTIDANGKVPVTQIIPVKLPKLWSVDSPNLYKAEVALLVNEKNEDITTTNFGIRTIEISPEKGFLLNNRMIELKGGCFHHDNGILGAAAIDRAEERKIEILKANGFNAIRCSHNPPSEKLLETCDRLGMLVIDEPFDQWKKAKNPNDYHRFFDEWWERDFSSMILRDRNHPSIILWSIGNEIEERYEPSGVEILKKLKSKANELDSSRGITLAVNEPWDHPGDTWANTAPAFEQLNVGGYNYQWWEYEKDHARFPGRIIVGTESVPIHALQNWELVEKHTYVIGDFVWTAMDYLGESGIGHTVYDTGKIRQLRPWPWFNGYCGDIDLVGNKKPQSYYRDVVWRRSKIELAVHAPRPNTNPEQVSYWGWPDEEQSWTWPDQEGKKMDINVYSRSPLVRLLLNGKLIGEKKPDSLLTAKFEVNYEPGELKAVAIENGQETGSVLLTTASAPKSLRLKADRSSITASRNDLAYVTVEIIDEHGKVVPHANLPVEFVIGGNGELAGTGNANPADMASFKQLKRKTFRGKCLVILRPKGSAGEIRLDAKSVGLNSASITISTK